MSVVADTHALLWWLQGGGRLDDRQIEALARAEASDARLCIAAVSLWEIAMLAERGRIQLPASTEAFLEELEASPPLRILPLDARVALEAVRLPDTVPRDPADRMIVATARVAGLPLVTADARLRKSGAVRVV